MNIKSTLVMAVLLFACDGTKVIDDPYILQYSNNERAYSFEGSEIVRWELQGESTTTSTFKLIDKRNRNFVFKNRSTPTYGTFEHLEVDDSSCPPTTVYALELTTHSTIERLKGKSPNICR